MLAEFFRLIFVSAAVLGVVVVGWNEPIKYRFMSRSEIAQYEAPPPPPPRENWQWDNPRGTKLDRGPMPTVVRK